MSRYICLFAAVFVLANLVKEILIFVHQLLTDKQEMNVTEESEREKAKLVSRFSNLNDLFVYLKRIQVKRDERPIFEE